MCPSLRSERSGPSSCRPRSWCSKPCLRPRSSSQEWALTTWTTFNGLLWHQNSTSMTIPSYKVKMEVFPSLTVKPNSSTPYTDATQVNFSAGCYQSSYSQRQFFLTVSEYLEIACWHPWAEEVLPIKNQKQLYIDNLSSIIRTNQQACAVCKNAPLVH